MQKLFNRNSIRAFVFTGVALLFTVSFFHSESLIQSAKAFYSGIEGAEEFEAQCITNNPFADAFYDFNNPYDPEENPQEYEEMRDWIKEKTRLYWKYSMLNSYNNPYASVYRKINFGNDPYAAYGVDFAEVCYTADARFDYYENFFDSPEIQAKLPDNGAVNTDMEYAPIEGAVTYQSNGRAVSLMADYLDIVRGKLEVYQGVDLGEFPGGVLLELEDPSKGEIILENYNPDSDDETDLFINDDKDIGEYSFVTSWLYRIQDLKFVPNEGAEGDTRVNVIILDIFDNRTEGTILLQNNSEFTIKHDKRFEEGNENIPLGQKAYNSNVIQVQTLTDDEVIIKDMYLENRGYGVFWMDLEKDDLCAPGWNMNDIYENGVCNFHYTFIPDEENKYTYDYLVIETENGSTMKIKIQGDSTSPIEVTYPDKVLGRDNFWVLESGETSKTRTVTVKSLDEENTHTLKDLEWLGVELNGDLLNQEQINSFQISNDTCTGKVFDNSGEDTCTFDITFTPKEGLHRYEANLIINVDGLHWISEKIRGAANVSILEGGESVDLETEKDGSGLFIELEEGKTGTVEVKEILKKDEFKGIKNQKAINKIVKVEKNGLEDGDFIAVVKLKYSDEDLAKVSTNEKDLVLHYFDTDANIWKLAGAKNTQGKMRNMGVSSYPENPVVEDIGKYGVDTEENVVWAVVDHFTDFAAGELAKEPTTTPETSTGGTGGSGGSGGSGGGATTTPTKTVTFPDITGNVFEKYIESLGEDGVVGGFSDGKYRPDSKVTRGQMAKFVVNAFNFEIDKTGEEFNDVNANDEKIGQYVQTLKNLGVIDGYGNGSYRSDDAVTRGAVTKFVVRAMEVKGVEVSYEMGNQFPDLADDHTFVEYISYLANVKVGGEKVIGGYSDGEFKADIELTRGQMAKIVDLSRKSL